MPYTYSHLFPRKDTNRKYKLKKKFCSVRGKAIAGKKGQEKVLQCVVGLFLQNTFY